MAIEQIIDLIVNKYGFPIAMVVFFVMGLNPSIKIITDLILELGKQINSYQNTNLSIMHAMYQIKEGNIDLAKEFLEEADKETKRSEAIVKSMEQNSKLDARTKLLTKLAKSSSNVVSNISATDLLNSQKEES